MDNTKKFLHNASLTMIIGSLILVSGICFIYYLFGKYDDAYLIYSILFSTVGFIVLTIGLSKLIIGKRCEKVSIQIFENGYKSIIKISQFLNMKPYIVSSTIAYMISKGMITDCIVHGDMIVIGNHDSHCLVCPKCGAHLLYLNENICEYCGEKIK